MPTEMPSLSNSWFLLHFAPSPDWLWGLEVQTLCLQKYEKFLKNECVCIILYSWLIIRTCKSVASSCNILYLCVGYLRNAPPQKKVFLTSCLASLGTTLVMDPSHEEQRVKISEWRPDMKWPSIFGMLNDRCLKSAIPSSCLTIFVWAPTSFGSITCCQAIEAWRCAVKQV